MHEVYGVFALDVQHGSATRVAPRSGGRGLSEIVRLRRVRLSIRVKISVRGRTSFAIIGFEVRIRRGESASSERSSNQGHRERALTMGKVKVTETRRVMGSGSAIEKRCAMAQEDDGGVYVKECVGVCL